MIQNMMQKTDNKIKSIIFDMDGVIIDSEEIWKRAEKEVFTSVGVKLSDDLCRLTEAMTTAEVTRFWFERQPWENKSLREIENEVIDRVAHLINKEGKAIDGIEEFIKSLKSIGFKIGLATNSPSRLIPVVLKRLRLDEFFDATASAEHESHGKPNPSVYLTVSKKLGSEPEACIAIEDSFSGLLAAKKAGMKTVFKDNFDRPENVNADYIISNYDQFDISFFN